MADAKYVYKNKDTSEYSDSFTSCIEWTKSKNNKWYISYPILLIWLISVVIASTGAYISSIFLYGLVLIHYILYKCGKTDELSYKKKMEMYTALIINLGSYITVNIMSKLGIWPLIIIGKKPGSKIPQDIWNHLIAQSTLYDVKFPNIHYAKLPVDKNMRFGMIRQGFIVSTHISMIDGFMLNAVTFPNVTKVIMKKSIAKAPLVGQLLLLSRQCYVTRNKKNKNENNNEKVYKRCKEIYDADVPIILFPEGTRRLNGRMLPFKTGCLTFACSIEMPILVSVIHGSHIACPPRSRMFNAHNIYLTFDDIILIPKSNSNVNDLIKVIKERMHLLLKKVPDYNEEIEKPIKDLNELHKITENQNKIAKVPDSLLGE